MPATTGPTTQTRLVREGWDGMRSQSTCSCGHDGDGDGDHDEDGDGDESDDMGRMQNTSSQWSDIVAGGLVADGM